MHTVHLLGGGTVDHVRPHLAIAAPAWGATALALARIIDDRGLFVDRRIRTTLTRMANPASRIETNEDVAILLDELAADPETHVIFLSMALCDWRGVVSGDPRRGKSAPRLRTDGGPVTLELLPSEKLVRRVRRVRKDIFLVAFKTTAGASTSEQFLAGLRLLKSASANLVFANDLHTKRCMVITPEQARYHETHDRQAALEGLAEMADLRSRLTFTRSTIVPGAPVAWTDPRVPASLRTVVDHCIRRGAYKPFLGSTVGHFAVKLADGSFLTSRRKTDFNRLGEIGLVRVETKGRDEVTAHGSKPSVGGQSQRIVFAEHPDLDCIVHFHCPLRQGALLPVREQRPYECGSHECGKNTSAGLVYVEPQIAAVMLDRHGPNIVFSSAIDPSRVIAFIERTFDLASSTDGVLLPPQPTMAAE
jgi:hypothetical protein